jgi:hypothetical protein
MEKKGVKSSGRNQRKIGNQAQLFDKTCEKVAGSSGRKYFLIWDTPWGRSGIKIIGKGQNFLHAL